ncbi:MAG: phenylalanine--tRNA ligase subunit beta [bacterium]|jgi:phenylalanyl-tRNA synthetase beta chain
MRIPYRWLQEFVKIDVSPEELCKQLIMLGFGEAEVLPNEWEMLDSFVAGRVTGVEPHPAVSGLKVVDVNVGFAEHKSVCGAPNVEVGHVYPVALPGAKLGSGVVVEQARISDVMSECILCSGWEAWIDDSKEELMALDSAVAPGTSLIDVLGLDEPIIEVEVTPNRPDCLGLIGIARELAAVYGKELLIPEPSLGSERSELSAMARVEVEDAEGCPRYGALVCDSMEVKRSPAHVRARLRLAGLRAINNVVDATNTVLFETGHPLHAFDLDRLEGGAIVVRRGKKGEKIKAIDGNEYDLNEDDVVIADANKPVAIAGIIGGENSEVGFSTEKILLEGAFFDHARVRRTAKRLGITTEASYRFERGVDVGAVLYVLARAASLIRTDKDCPFHAGKIDVYPDPRPPRHVFADPKRINRLLGTSIPEQEMCDYLERLGFLVNPGKELEVVVPSRRNDVEGEADVAEEILRLYGYDRIGERTAVSTQSYGRIDGKLRITGTIEETLLGMDITQVLTDSMLGPTSLEKFRISRENVIPVRNPLGVETSFMRPSMIPGVAEVLARNLNRGRDSVAVFEIGKTFRARGSEFDERYTLTIGMSGLSREKSWHSEPREFDFFDIKGAVESLAAYLDVNISFGPSEVSYLHPGRRARVQVGEKGGEVPVGCVGELLPAIVEEIGVARRIFLAELDLDALMDRVREGVRYVKIPRFPGLKRDLAVIVPRSVVEADVRGLILSEGGPLLKGLDLFDVYTGEQVPEGMVSLAYNAVFQSDERTLQEDEVNDLQKKIEDSIANRLGGRLRSS